MKGMKKSGVWGLIAAAGLTGFLGAGIVTAAAPSALTQPGRKAAGPQVGEVAPAWETKDPEGKTHKLADYKGKIVVMDFWATWCPPCRQAMPGLQKIHEQYKDQGVVVLGMNFAERPGGDPVGYMKEQEFTYGLMLNSEEIAKAYGVSGIPAFFVVGPDGKVIHRAVGFGPDTKQKLEEVIKANLPAVKKDAKKTTDAKDTKATPDSTAVGRKPATDGKK